MISLKDYNFLYSDVHYDSPKNKKLKTSQGMPFVYLYPSEVESIQKSIYYNQKQQLFTVTIIEDLQEAQKIIEIIKNKGQIFSPSQQFIVAEHKNPNAQKRLIIIATIDRQHALKHFSQNCFFQNTKVPSEEFCSDLIERMLAFIRVLEQKGFNLKLITPEHIICFGGKFHLTYPFPHDLNEMSIKVFEQMQKYDHFAAPQILKVINNSKANLNKQSQDPQKTNGVNISCNFQGKGFKKSILYSLALTILFIFGHSIPVQDRYACLKNPRHLNTHIDQLRKEIKLHHDGKYISKLLKLMLEHSQTLRDTINTFTYKINSIQFQLLKKIIVRHPVNQKDENVRTQSEINSNPMLRTSSGKKTIDIRISSMSNASSLINRSWLSGSQRETEKMMSPFDTNKSLPGDKEYLQRSKHQISPNELNRIEEEKNDPGSPIEFDIDWQEDVSVNGSSKSRRSKVKSEKQCLEKEKKQPPGTLLNKISQKQQNDEDVEVKAVKGPGKSQNQQYKKSQKESDVHISMSSLNEQLELKEQDQKDNFSRTESGMKGQRIGQETYKTEPDIQDEKPLKLPLKFEETEYHQPTIGYIESKNKFKTFETAQLQESVYLQAGEINQPSSMAIFPHIRVPANIESISLNESTTFQMNPNVETHNESLIFEESFGDGDEFQAHQLFLEKAKSKQKHKLTERKKDQYNERSRIILATLAVIYAVFYLIEWLLNKQSV